MKSVRKAQRRGLDILWFVEIALCRAAKSEFKERLSPAWHEFYLEVSPFEQAYFGAISDSREAFYVAGDEATRRGLKGDAYLDYTRPARDAYEAAMDEAAKAYYRDLRSARKALSEKMTRAFVDACRLHDKLIKEKK